MAHVLAIATELADLIAQTAVWGHVKDRAMVTASLVAIHPVINKILLVQVNFSSIICTSILIIRNVKEHIVL